MLYLNHLILSYPVPTTLLLNYFLTVAVTNFNSTNLHLDSLITGTSKFLVVWNIVLYSYNNPAPAHTSGSSLDTSITFDITLLLSGQGSSLLFKISDRGHSGWPPVNVPVWYHPYPDYVFHEIGLVWYYAAISFLLCENY